jgi:hypothetical protein
MSAENPPTFSFNGIDFNPTYYVNESTSSGFTQEQANALYLQKTIPDTATAIETFNAGIKTNSIESVVDTGTLNIQTVSSTATNIVNVGNNTTNNQTLNLNSKIINVGDTTVPSAINIISPATFTPSATFSNGISSLNVQSISGQNLDIATTQGDGTLSIGTGTRTGPINIGTAMQNGSILAIGSTTGSIIKFGSVSANTTQITPSTSSMNITSVGPADGDFYLCSTQQTGVLNIGTATARTAAINIATTKNTSSAQSINIGSSNASATGQVISINRPLKINYSTLPTLTDLGYYVNYTDTSQAITSGANNIIVTIPIQTAGLYIVDIQIIFTIGATAIRFTRQRFGIQQTVGTYLNNLYTSTIGTYDKPLTGEYVESTSGIYRFTGATNYFLICDSLFTLSTLSAVGNVIITRIG